MSYNTTERKWPELLSHMFTYVGYIYIYVIFYYILYIPLWGNKENHDAPSILKELMVQWGRPSLIIKEKGDSGASEVSARDLRGVNGGGS